MIDDVINRIRKNYRIKLLEKELREERLVRKVSDEYEEFRKEELRKSKEELFDEAGKIWFYDEVHNYFLECGEMDEDYTEYLINKDHIISYLWDGFLKLDGYSIGTRDDIEELMSDLIEDEEDFGHDGRGQDDGDCIG